MFMRKYLFLFLLMNFVGFEVCAQIPRMRKEAWYKEKIESKMKAGEVLRQADEIDSDVLTTMRAANQAKDNEKVISLYPQALAEVPGNASIYNWERAALRELIRNAQEGEVEMDWLNQLMKVYNDRSLSPLEEDPYEYNRATQWNNWQLGVDYARYSRNLQSNEVRYRTMEKMLANMGGHPDPYVLQEMMDISFSDNTLSENEFYRRYEMLFSQAGQTKEWLNSQFLNIDQAALDNAMQALNSREQNWSNDSRIMNVVGKDYNLYVERFGETIRANMNNEGFLKNRLLQMRPFKGKPLYNQIVDRLCEIGSIETLMSLSDDARQNNDATLAQRMSSAAESKANNPDELSRLYVLQASQHITKKEWYKAVELLNKSIAINEDNATAYILLSECYIGNAAIVCRQNNYLDKYTSQFAMIAAIEMLREKRNLVMNEQSKNQIGQRIETLRASVNQHPILKQDLFRLSMSYGDTVRLGGYVNRTIVMKEKY